MSSVSGVAGPDLEPEQCVVLVVEDEWLIRLAVSEGLRETGWRVVEAADGVEAIDYIQSGAPLDLILSDVRMPGSVDGLALLTFAKRTLPDVPVILSSGHLEPAQAIAAGATDFLGKPYRIMELEKIIVRSLAGK